jgi:hypothetical protein
MRKNVMRLTVAALLLGLVAGPAAARDRDDNPAGWRGGPGSDWENPPGPRGGPGASPHRPRWHGWHRPGPVGRHGLLPRPWRWDRHHNPPGRRGGPGTDWANPPGPRGGPGASPHRWPRPHYRYRYR